jgi:hypothetical protein
MGQGAMRRCDPQMSGIWNDFVSLHNYFLLLRFLKNCGNLIDGDLSLSL